MKTLQISDSEMRVYADYQNDIINLYSDILRLNRDLKEIDGKFYSASVLKINKDKHYCGDVGLSKVIAKDELLKQIKDLSNEYHRKEEFCQRIYDQLYDLNESDKQLLNYRYLDKLTYDQIAEKIHSNHTSVRDRLHKILKFKVA